MLAQKLSTPVPMEETTPWPVTTTRLPFTPVMSCLYLRPPQTGGSPCSGRGASRILFRDERTDAINDRTDCREVLNFFIRVVRDLNTEGVLDIEDNHGKIEGLDLKVAKLGIQSNRLRRVL